MSLYLLGGVAATFLSGLLYVLVEDNAGKWSSLIFAACVIFPSWAFTMYALLLVMMEMLP